MQSKNVAEVMQQLVILRDQTERSFNAIVSRVNLLEAGGGVGERGKKMQDQIDGLASDLRRVRRRGRMMMRRSIWCFVAAVVGCSGSRA